MRCLDIAATTLSPPANAVGRRIQANPISLAPFQPSIARNLMRDKDVIAIALGM
jgi:hypothetical protein